MKQRPLVSVCIANYNGMAVIDDCLGSVLAQKGELAVEIIVHDDASTDDSVAHIKTQYPSVQVVESDRNVGFCIANNRMADLATGEYLLLLNNDAALFDDALITLYRSALDAGEAAILGLPQYDADTGELLDNGSLLDPFLNPVPNKDIDRHEVGMIMGACLWLPRTLWHEIGGFPEWMESIGEDLYLCCRARLEGLPVLSLGRSGYLHKVGSSFGGGKVDGGRLVTNRRRRALSERNKTFVMLICHPAIPLFLLAPLHLMLLHLEGLLVSLLKCKIAIWREVYRPLIPALWHNRMRILALRKIAQSRRGIKLRAWFGPYRWIPWKMTLLVRHGLPEIH